MVKKHTRLKSFEGLPHEVNMGIDYTEGSYVEGGEKAYSPLGSENEFIVRKNSLNLPALEKEDKLRSKREPGDRISDQSFDIAAREILMQESKDLMSEGINPFNSGKDVFQTGGTRMRHTPDGTLNQSAPRQNMEEMNTGEVVGWTILDTLLGDMLGLTHFTGRSPSEMWSGKGTKKPEPGKTKADSDAPVTAGTVAGVYQSQYQIPVGNKVVQQIPVAGEFAKMGDASRSMAQPAIDADAEKQGVNMYQGGLYSGGTGSAPNFNNLNFGGDPSQQQSQQPQEIDIAGAGSNWEVGEGINAPDVSGYQMQGPDVQATDQLGGQPLILKNGGARKMYADGGAIANNILGFGLNAFPAISYLSSQRDYDKVRYPLLDPTLMSAEVPLRETRDAFASSREALAEKGRLDIGALSELATQQAKAAAGVRENIQNLNTQLLNTAKEKNQQTLIRQFTDEAANKGAYLTNKQQALNDLKRAGAGTLRQQGMIDNDELLRQMFEETFGNA